MTGDAVGAAEGINVALRDGSVKWMNLAAIWGKPDIYFFTMMDSRICCMMRACSPSPA
jgi:hypothetical protein